MKIVCRIFDFSLIFLCFLFLSCSSQSTALRSEFVLGTVCTINAFDNGTSSLYNELFNRLHQIDDEFSVNRSNSEISCINQSAGVQPVSVTKDVYFVIQTALYYARLSDGAFDPTIGPLVKLWGINTDHARVPSKGEINSILPLINWKDVELDQNSKTVYLKRKKMSLDLGGIAKGYAADELVTILKKHHVKRAIIDLGGNIYVFGKKSNGSLWRVGIKDPDHSDGNPALALSLQNSTVVTSGVYERFFEQDGIRYHHILDPKTGYPAKTGLLSSTIVCERSITADALSTSVFVLGIDKGFTLLKKINYSENGIDGLYAEPHAVFITTDHRIIASERLSSVLSSVNASYPEPEYR